MITTISIENLGPIPQMTADGLGKVNLVIGPNQSGKTFLLKALFAGLKTVEQYKRGKENRTDKEIISDKLYWTFQASELGSIVRKGESSMSFSMVSDKKEELTCSFGPSAKKQARPRRYCPFATSFSRPRTRGVLASKSHIAIWPKPSVVPRKVRTMMPFPMPVKL